MQWKKEEEKEEEDMTRLYGVWSTEYNRLRLLTGQRQVGREKAAVAKPDNFAPTSEVWTEAWVGPTAAVPSPLRPQLTEEFLAREGPAGGALARNCEGNRWKARRGLDRSRCGCTASMYYW